jgi:hypothetical protein
MLIIPSKNWNDYCEATHRGYGFGTPSLFALQWVINIWTLILYTSKSRGGRQFHEAATAAQALDCGNQFHKFRK